MSTPARSFVTPEEYVEAERKATTRHEYVDGQVYAMTGASRAHNLITSNLVSGLIARLRGRPCETYANDMRVKVALTGPYAYPDVVVVCGPPQFEDQHTDTLLNPTVIVEVLSPSTEAYDRGKKFAHYRQLSSLSEYVLVAQDQPAVERFDRQDGLWVLAAVHGLDATVTLDAIGCALPLREIYERVDFVEGDARGPAPA